MESVSTSECPDSDCTANNIMVCESRMYPNGSRPTQIKRNNGCLNDTTNLKRPPFYHFVGFALSRHYTSRDVIDEPLSGGYKSAPEHRSRSQCNPFSADIYDIGNLVRQEFMEVCPVSEYTFTRLVSSTPLGVLRPRIHGRFDQLDDTRRSG